MKFQLHLSLSLSQNDKTPVDTVQLKEGVRGCTVLLPTISRPSPSCDPWKCSMGFSLSVARKSQFAAVSIFSAVYINSLRWEFSLIMHEGQESKPSKSMDCISVGFDSLWTWHPTAEWKGRTAQNIQEYCRKEDGEGGLAGNIQHFFRSVKTDDKLKIKQQPEWPSYIKCFSPSILTKRPCFSPLVSLSKPGLIL